MTQVIEGMDIGARLAERASEESGRLSYRPLEWIPIYGGIRLGDRVHLELHDKRISNEEMSQINMRRAWHYVVDPLATITLIGGAEAGLVYLVRQLM